MSARVACPTCGRMKPDFAIRNNRCRDDLLDGERASAQPYQIGWNDIRAERNKRLTACDWTQVPDAPVDAEAWATYRQALRDVPQAFETPGEVVWPTPPE